ncbi:unnamed protein product [Rhizophagus irregularis]|nr:unnamed protein product [Rhizophagus irregularis]
MNFPSTQRELAALTDEEVLDLLKFYNLRPLAGLISYLSFSSWLINVSGCLITAKEINKIPHTVGYNNQGYRDFLVTISRVLYLNK